MAKSLNRVQLIGNLTRDPELRYTPSGSAVCSFGIATNRSWTTDTGEKREEADFHNIVAWRKLAEICSQYLKKGGKVYVEGRLTTRSWIAQDGQQKSRTEVVIDDMIMLDGRGQGTAAVASGTSEGQPASVASFVEAKPSSAKGFGEVIQKTASTKKQEEETETKVAEDSPAAPGNTEEEVSPDDIPF